MVRLSPYVAPLRHDGVAKVGWFRRKREGVFVYLTRFYVENSRISTWLWINLIESSLAIRLVVVRSSCDVSWRNGTIFKSFDRERENSKLFFDFLRPLKEFVRDFSWREFLLGGTQGTKGFGGRRSNFWVKFLLVNFLAFCTSLRRWQSAFPLSDRAEIFYLVSLTPELLIAKVSLP